MGATERKYPLPTANNANALSHKHTSSQKVCSSQKRHMAWKKKGNQKTCALSVSGYLHIDEPTSLVSFDDDQASPQEVFKDASDARASIAVEGP